MPGLKMEMHKVTGCIYLTMAGYAQVYQLYPSAIAYVTWRPQ